MRVTNKRMLDAIKKNGGAVYLAARELGCAPNTIYNRMQVKFNTGEAYEV